MIRFEQCVIAGGIGAEVLMERAAQRLATRILEEYSAEQAALVLVGKGNNGGDGIAVARHLARAGWRVRLHFVESSACLSPLARQHWLSWRSEQPSGSASEGDRAVPWPAGQGLVLDAMTGVGAKGFLRGAPACIAEEHNHRRRISRWQTVAIDCPSGLAGSDGKAPQQAGDAVQADLTLTLGVPKEVLLKESLADWTGRIDCLPLFDEVDELPAGRGLDLLTGAEMAELLPRRKASAHKGELGRLVIVGGSPGFTGAPLLAAQGALRAGAGLVQVLVPESIRAAVEARAPWECMSGLRDAANLRAALEHAQAIVAGPGLGTGAEASSVVEALLQADSRTPVLFDADALTLLAARHDLQARLRPHHILTPHPGEMRRMLGRFFTPEEREEVVRDWSDQHPGVLVLKGCRTLVAAAGRPLAVNGTGHAGMARGGSGDVLAGVTGALLARGLDPFAASCLGVWIHGKAAELAAPRSTLESMLPHEAAEQCGAALEWARVQQERAAAIRKLVAPDV